MSGLNGTCGGVLPATVSFAEIVIEDGYGNNIIEYPLMKDIIYKLVQQFGKENPSKIIIDDVPDVGRQVVAWNNTTPIRFQAAQETYKILGKNFKISNISDPNFPEVYYQNDLVGYMETDLTYPGDLTKNAGTTVT